MQDLILGGLEVRKFSAKPSNDRYQASWDDAIFASLAVAPGALLYTLYVERLLYGIIYLTTHERATVQVPRAARLTRYRSERERMKLFATILSPELLSLDADVVYTYT